VRRIQQTQDKVTVGIETVNGGVEVVADSAIVAVPWSVLRHVPLEIPLTNIQREAISTLPYGAVVKTLLQYPDRFWSQPNLGIVLLEGEYQAIWEPTFAQPGTTRILSCFSGGAPSLQLGQQALDKAKQTIYTVYPQAPEAIACLSYDWNADEWARGAYCYFAPGQIERLHPHLSLAAGRVFFAGEHTAPVEYSGYMEGAIHSGQRAAQQVLKLAMS
jgi:monoamine oxidase